MNYMKKLLVITVLVACFSMLSACGDSNNTTAEITTSNMTTKPETTVAPETVLEETTVAVTTTAEQTTVEVTEIETTTQVQTEPNVELTYSDELFVLPKDGQRPVAVMIDNQGSGPLPQGSPGLAQIVYEVLVEGGLTRLMPIYWGQNIEYIGPVRSARHYFLDYMKEYDSFYVHYGWSPQAKYDIYNLGIQVANGVSNAYSIYWDLTKDKSNWQDTYTDNDNIEGIMKYFGFSQSTDVNIASKFNDEWVIPDKGDDCNEITIQYSSAYKVGYVFNQKNGLYDRYRQGKPHMERNTDEQIQVGNILIMYVKNYTIKGDTEGRQNLETVGEGHGYYITSGKIQEIKWSKSGRFSPTVYTDSDGNEISYNPGRTWIQVVPTTGIINYD